MFGSSTFFLGFVKFVFFIIAKDICVCSYSTDNDIRVGIVYCVYNTSYEEFVRVIVLGGRTPNVV